MCRIIKARAYLLLCASADTACVADDGDVRSVESPKGLYVSFENFMPVGGFQVVVRKCCLPFSSRPI